MADRRPGRGYEQPLISPRIKAMMVEEAKTAQVVAFHVDVNRQMQVGEPDA